MRTQKSKSHTFRIVLLLILIPMLFLWLFTPLIASLIFVEGNNYNWDLLSKVGDTFNTFSSFISAFSFLMVIATLYYQRKEFFDQRQELQSQREQLKINTQLGILMTQWMAAEQKNDSKKLRKINGEMELFKEKLNDI